MFELDVGVVSGNIDCYCDGMNYISNLHRKTYVQIDQ